MTQQHFFTDKQLCRRWQCSNVKLWRMRQDGRLSKPFKAGGTGLNLTTASEVHAIEGGKAEKLPEGTDA